MYIKEDCEWDLESFQETVPQYLISHLYRTHYYRLGCEQKTYAGDI